MSVAQQRTTGGNGGLVVGIVIGAGLAAAAWFGVESWRRSAPGRAPAPGPASIAPASTPAPATPASAPADWPQRWRTLGFPPRPATMPPMVTREYHRFDDATSITTRLQLPTLPARGTLTLRFMGTFSGEVTVPAAPPRHVSITAEQASGGEAVVIVDGQRLTLEDSRRVGDWQMFTVETDAVVAMANARTVEARIGTDEVALTPEHLRQLQDWLGMLRP